MKGRRSQKYNKEYDLLEKLKHENQKLKRENARLRKELSKIDISHFEHLRDLVDQQTAEELQKVPKSKRQEQKEKWKCFECEEGTLKIIIINRQDGPHYFRKCNNCTHKTKMQKFNNEVEGYD